LTNGQVLHAVNDLFVGARSHTSALYEIRVGEQRETQSSSGLIVATGLGSTVCFRGPLHDAGEWGDFQRRHRGRCLDFNSGTEVQITLADRKGRLVM
jgi:hypothetical protein